MSYDVDQPLIIGRLGSPHGIRGWIKIVSYTEPPENIFSYQPWQLIFPDKQLKTVKVVANHLLSSRLTAQIEGCTDRNAASLLTGAEVSIYRHQLPPLPIGEYYWTDLIGLRVITLADQNLGLIEDIFSTGANDVIVVKGEKKYLIPYLLNQVIVEINLDENYIKVDWDPEF